MCSQVSAIRHLAVAMAMEVLLAIGMQGCSDSGGEPPAPSLAVFAGNMGGPGTMDGNVADARFYRPQGVAVDTVGNVYVADRGNKTIRKITPSGEVTTLAGTAGVRGDGGYYSATGPDATFADPYDLAVDGAGNVYVVDQLVEETIYNSYYQISKITPAGVVTALWGGPLYPDGIAVDRVGNVYISVSDPTIRCNLDPSLPFPSPPGCNSIKFGNSSGNNILKITPAGVGTTLADTSAVCGMLDGAVSAPFACGPSAIAVDGAGNVYVVFDRILKISPSGSVTVVLDTLGITSMYDRPTGIAFDGTDNIYVTTKSAIRKVTPDGVVTVFAGDPSISGSADGNGASAKFKWIAGLATDSAGNVYVADSGSNTIRKITPNGFVTTLTGTAGFNGSVDGTGTAARFGLWYTVNSNYSDYTGQLGSFYLGMATDSGGNLYVVDAGNSTVRKITPDAVVTTLAGSVGEQFGTMDGIGTAAHFRWPRGVAVDRMNNLYIVDDNSIRKITPDAVVTTIAGTFSAIGSEDGFGVGARFNHPFDIAVDGAGNLYVTDSGNHTIRKITPTANVTTFAGGAGAPGNADGVGVAARFFLPRGLGIDSTGNLYVFDSGNYTIRKITPDGVVTTLAGAAGLAGNIDGTGAGARFSGRFSGNLLLSGPTSGGIATDSAGNVYVADAYNSTIRKVTPDGVVTTIVGMPRVSGFVPGGLPGVVSSPSGIAISGGALYFTTNQGVAVVRDLQ